MKKFFLTVLACLMLVTASTNAAILEDDAGFSYVINYNYLIFSTGNKFCSAYDLSSIHILADNNQRFEFNIMDLTIRLGSEEIIKRRIKKIREDYSTGKIYEDGEISSTSWDISTGNTQREIYYKMKSAALSR